MSMGYGGIFGNPYGSDTGGFGGGIFGQPRKRFGIDALEQQQPMAPPFMGAERMPAPAAPVAEQPAKGDKTKRIIGIIGDALLGLGGQQGVYGPMMAQKRAEERQMEMMQQQRRQGLEDYRSRKLVDQEFAQPEMDEFDTAMARAGIPKGSPQYNTYAQEYAKRKASGADPFLQGAPLPGGGSFTGSFGDYQQMIGGGAKPQGSGPAVGAVEDGFRFRGGNPADPNSWEPVSGGAASNGSGNFRP